MNAFTVTSLPRIRGKATSEMYIGVVKEATPMPIPTTTRPNSKVAKFQATKRMHDPKQNTLAANSIATRRPYFELMRSPNKLLKKAANTVMLTTISCCPSAKEKARRKGSIAPLMTPEKKKIEKIHRAKSDNVIKYIQQQHKSHNQHLPVS
jgi:hypothetical protein